MNAAMASKVTPTKEPERPAVKSSFLLETDADGIAVLTFDRPGSSANTFEASNLVELDEILATLETNPIKSLIVTSNKPRIFIAGADIRSILNHPDKSEQESVIALGQSVFTRLASLPFPTVAAIHGACLGGGYELALACDHRVASDDPATRIGLPEVQLGILPAWGGCTRLPRLVGLRQALALILQGKTLPPAQALRTGMIDEVVPREYLLRTARQFAGKGKTTLPRHWLKHHFISAALMRFIAGRHLDPTARRHYPAVTRALDVVCRSVHVSVCESLENEKRAILDLLETPQAKHLIRIFLLQDRAKKRSSDESMPKPPAVKRAAVIGAGVMGAGITHWLTSRQVSVHLIDLSAEHVAKGLHKIEELYHAGVKRRLLTRLEARDGIDRVFPVTSGAPLRQASFIIEAAVEELSTKENILADLDKRMHPRAILATNTSALSIDKLAMATSRPDRFLGLHFFNPVHRMKLVEVVQGTQTSKETMHRALAFVHQLGKLPVVVKDSPGFIVNRILMPYLVEAVTLLEKGVDMTTIDTAMVDFGMPMGPLRLLDEVGLDVARHVCTTLESALGPRAKSPRILDELLARDWTGRKAGTGFYEYSGKSGERPNPRIQEILPPSTGADAGEIQTHLIAMMVNEAARCVEEQITDDADDIDFAMIMGTGFAPFRGGPLRYADAAGSSTLIDALESAGHLPCGRLLEHARKDRPFHQD